MKHRLVSTPYLPLRRMLQTLATFVASLCLFHDSRAAEFDQPTWGRIVEATDLPGVYRLEIAKPPTNGRLTLPAGLLPVVRCELTASRKSQPLDFEFDTAAKAAVVLLGRTDSHNAVLRVQTAGKTPQTADGRIVLLASSAAGKATKGTPATEGAKPESRETATVTPTQKSITWNYDATRWGKYSVSLTYAANGRGETAIQFSMGEGRLTGHLKPTGNSRRFTTVNLGAIYLAKAGRHSPTVLVDAATNADVNIQGVILDPACEGKPPVQNDDGTIVLHSRDSTIHGTVLRYEPDPKKNTLGYWARATDGASWQFTVNRPGTYDVEVLQGCGKGEGGSEVVVRVNARELSFVVEDTGHFQNFKPRMIGRVDFSTTGEHTIVVQPRKIARHATLDLRQIRLIPAKGPAN